MSSTSDTPILPGATVGILGGGQLGKMTAQALQRLGYKVAIFCPPGDNPAAQITDQAFIAPYDDKVSLRRFAETCQVVTSEFENVPAGVLQFLSELTRVHPKARVFEVAQDRLREKKLARKLGIPTVAYYAVERAEDLFQIVPGKYILKTQRLGYDGKGQEIVTTLEETRAAWKKLGEVPCVLETYLDFDYEVSVIVGRSEAARTVNFPLVRNAHRDGILRVTHYPAHTPKERHNGAVLNVEQQAIEMAQKIAQYLGVIGLLAVEMFVAGETVYFNEIAPRPHNSGHWTIEGCDVSQFELLARLICNLPFEQPRPIVLAARMSNLIGDYSRALMTYLSTPDVHVHIYGKKEARPGRKMGHVTRIH